MSTTTTLASENQAGTKMARRLAGKENACSPSTQKSLILLQSIREGIQLSGCTVGWIFGDQ
jgi:hypothetical protein